MSKNSRSLKVLIVDDDAAIRRAVRQALGECDAIQISGEAADVPEAIGAVRMLQPDLVILDIVMPGGTGFDVLNVAKGLLSTPTVALFSSFGLPHMKTQCGRLGADFFFDKATEFDLMCDTVIETAISFRKRHILSPVQDPATV